MEAIYHELAIRAEQALAASMRDLYDAAPPDLAAELGLHLLDIGGAIGTCSAQWDTIHVNRVFNLGVTEPATEAAIDDFIAFYRKAGVRFAVGLSPIARPATLAKWLAARKFAQVSNTTILHRGIEPLETQTALRIACIDTPSAAMFAEVLCEGFPLPDFFGRWLAATVGRPGRRHYIAFDGITPVAAAMIFVHEKVAVLDFAATLDSYRRRGAQRVLIAQRIRDAAELGCTLVITNTEEDTPENPSWSCRNLQKAGFRITYLQPSYLSPLLHSSIHT